MLDMQTAEAVGTILHRFRDSSNEHNAIDALLRIAHAIETHADAMHRIADACLDNDGRGIAQSLTSGIRELSRVGSIIAGAQEIRAGL